MLLRVRRSFFRGHPGDPGHEDVQKVVRKVIDVCNAKGKPFGIFVGTTEADVYKNKISNESPLGQALIGGKVGDTVVVHAPSCDYPIKILAIKRS